MKITVKLIIAFALAIVFLPSRVQAWHVPNCPMRFADGTVAAVCPWSYARPYTPRFEVPRIPV